MQRRPKRPQNNVYVSCLVINPSLDKTLGVPIKRFALQNGGKSLPLLGLSWLEKRGTQKKGFVGTRKPARAGEKSSFTADPSHL